MNNGGRPRMAVIDNIGGELGGYLFRREAGVFEGEFDIVGLAAQEGLPGDAAEWAASENIAALVIGGALASPLDDDEWIRREEEFLRGFAAAGLPVLGICFGHEILTSAFGGRLAHLGEYRVEPDTIRLLRPDPLFDGFGPTARIPVAHSVMVTAAPADFEVIGSSEKCAVNVMKHRALPIYGTQFHPEVDPDIRIFDPDWNVIPEAELQNPDGCRVMVNFKRIALNFIVHSRPPGRT